MVLYIRIIVEHIVEFLYAETFFEVQVYSVFILWAHSEKIISLERLQMHQKLFFMALCDVAI